VAINACVTGEIGRHVTVPSFIEHRATSTAESSAVAPAALLICNDPERQHTSVSAHPLVWMRSSPESNFEMLFDCARARETIRLRSVEGPSSRVQPVCHAPSKAAICPVEDSLCLPRGPKSRSTPAPRTRTSVRSYPSKAEKGPSRSMVARLSRQSKSLPACAASPPVRQISRVTPPPFFQGTATYPDSLSTIIRAIRGITDY